MSAMSDVNPIRISPAGAAAMEEYLASERKRILEEASRLSEVSPLSSFDIVNAIDALNVRGNLEIRQRVRPSQMQSRYLSRISLLAMVSLFSVIMSAVLLVVALNSKWELATEVPSSLMNILAGGLVATSILAAAVAFMFTLRAYRQANKLQVHRELVGENPNLSISDPVRVHFERGDSLREAVNEGTSMSYLAKWISVESMLRRLGVQSLGIPSDDARRYPIGELLRMLLRAKVIDSEIYGDTRHALQLRNRILHEGVSNIGPDSEQQVVVLGYNLEKLINQYDDMR